MRSAILRLVRWWAGPLLLAAIALAFDAADRSIRFGVWTTGPVDEVAHLSTAARCSISRGTSLKVTRGVRVFWPLQDTSWMISYRWFPGMIVVLTAARLVL